ncbi:cellulose synthase complex periplasmic endoglucanase BcsZ [Vibrio sp. RC27]
MNVKSIIGLLMLPSFTSFAEQCDWPEWEGFKEHFIVDGRVIDYSDERKITTSEGQSYAMFFALVANDRKTFDQLFHWTQTELSNGNIGSTLPAWLWGWNKELGRYDVLDSNSASDSDLWIAYDLAEAGIIWNNYAYRSASKRLAKNILEYETVNVDNYGLVLLPGPVGFDLGRNTYRLNPSYSPIQILERIAQLNSDSKWDDLISSGYRVTYDSAHNGFSPDWIEVTNGKLQVDRKTDGVGSYNSIRSYLWAGMLHDDAPQKEALLKRFKPMVSSTKVKGYPPRLANTIRGTAKEQGSEGFSASMLPMLKSLNENRALKRQLARVKKGMKFDNNERYYDSVLTLYSLGWLEGRYRFGASGELILPSNEQCKS